MPLKELLTLIVAIPAFLFLSAICPQTHALFVVGWLFCLGFDLHSTYKFYLEKPSQFPNNERNKLFVWLTKKSGFKKATILFPILIEIPLLLFFALLPLQTLHTYLFPNTPNQLIACIIASFGICAIGHLQAALKNTKLNHKQPVGSQGCPKTRQSLSRYDQTLATTIITKHPKTNQTNNNTSTTNRQKHKLNNTLNQDYFIQRYF